MISVSPSRTNARASLSFGRLTRLVPLALSTKIRSAPLARQQVNLSASFWPVEETRA